MNPMRARIRNSWKSSGRTVKDDESVRTSLIKSGWSSGSAVSDLVEWVFWDGEHGGSIDDLSTFQNIVDEYTF